MISSKEPPSAGVTDGQRISVYLNGRAELSGNTELGNGPGGLRIDYDEAMRLFQAAGLVDQGTVVTPTAVYRAGESDGGADNYHIYNQFVIRVPDRPALRDALSARTSVVVSHRMAAVRDADEILAAMEAAKARGEGATVYKGRLVDIASIKQAEVIVKQAELIGSN